MGDEIDSPERAYLLQAPISPCASSLEIQLYQLLPVVFLSQLVQLETRSCNELDFGSGRSNGIWSSLNGSASSFRRLRPWWKSDSEILIDPWFTILVAYS